MGAFPGDRVARLSKALTLPPAGAPELLKVAPLRPMSPGVRREEHSTSGTPHPKHVISVSVAAASQEGRWGCCGVGGACPAPAPLRRAG